MNTEPSLEIQLVVGKHRYSTTVAHTPVEFLEVLFKRGLGNGVPNPSLDLMPYLLGLPGLSNGKPPSIPLPITSSDCVCHLRLLITGSEDQDSCAKEYTLHLESSMFNASRKALHVHSPDEVFAIDYRVPEKPGSRIEAVTFNFGHIPFFQGLLNYVGVAVTLKEIHALKQSLTQVIAHELEAKERAEGIVGKARLAQELAAGILTNAGSAKEMQKLKEDIKRHQQELSRLRRLDDMEEDLHTSLKEVLNGE